MILSVSRRTDIPAWYAEWFCNRIRQGFVCVRNPMNFHQVSRISLSPDMVDGIVFWTRNPLPLMHHLDELRAYPFYFQFTLTPYGKEIEPGVPDKQAVLLPAFQKLSRQIGPDRVIWRYDPILLSSRYSVDFHLTAFRELAQQLEGYTRKCVISFLDPYRSIESNMNRLGFRPPADREITALAQGLAAIAAGHHLALETCAEAISLEAFGIAHGHCIDRVLLERLAGCPLKLEKDKNQREACGCAASVDIGMYDTCRHGCLYCYATRHPGAVPRHCAAHDPNSPLLSGSILPEDRVHEREGKSCREEQLRFC